MLQHYHLLRSQYPSFESISYLCLPTTSPMRAITVNFFLKVRLTPDSLTHPGFYPRKPKPELTPTRIGPKTFQHPINRSQCGPMGRGNQGIHPDADVWGPSGECIHCYCASELRAQTKVLGQQYIIVSPHHPRATYSRAKCSAAEE
jgi:hypothetical protein